MRMSKIVFALFILGLSGGRVTGQSSKDSPTASLVQVQPTIMVIPFVKENENIRTVLESDINRRVVITKVKEGFDQRGVNTIDFLVKLKQAGLDKAMEINNQTSLKQQIIELSGADVYVETEVKEQLSDNGNSVTVILTAYEAFNGQSLANKVGSTQKFYTNDLGKLAEKAVEGCIEDFLNTLNSKFAQMVQDGRSLSLSLTFAPNSKYSMDSEVGMDKNLLSDVLEEWFSKNAYKNYVHIQGITSTKMIVDDLRIPLKDEEGKSFRPSIFLADLRKFLKTLGIESSRDIQGSKLFLTLN